LKSSLLLLLLLLYVERCLVLFVYGYYISVITRIDYSNNCVLNERCDDVSPVFFLFFVPRVNRLCVCDI